MWWLILTFLKLFLLVVLVSSLFLTRASCHKTAHVNGYCGAWPGGRFQSVCLPYRMKKHLGKCKPYGGSWILIESDDLSRGRAKPQMVFVSGKRIKILKMMVCIANRLSS